MGKNTEAHLRAVAKYKASNVIRCVMDLNRNTDADIISRLNEVQSKQGYIKSLIRADIARKEAECE